MFSDRVSCSLAWILVQTYNNNIPITTLRKIILHKISLNQFIFYKKYRQISCYSNLTWHSPATPAVVIWKKGASGDRSNSTHSDVESNSLKMSLKSADCKITLLTTLLAGKSKSRTSSASRVFSEQSVMTPPSSSLKHDKVSRGLPCSQVCLL